MAHELNTLTATDNACVGGVGSCSCCRYRCRCLCCRRCCGDVRLGLQLVSFRPQLVRHSLAIRTCERLCHRVESKLTEIEKSVGKFKIKKNVVQLKSIECNLQVLTELKMFA